MDTWTLKKGYPVVTIEKLKNNTSGIKLKQNWFLLNPQSKLLNTKIYEDTKWFIPFTYTLKSNAKFDFESKPHWLSLNDSKEVFLSIEIQEKEWIIGNIKHAGFYRVNYDQNNWDLLIDQLNTNYDLIDVINRAQLIDDSFSLSRAEYINPIVYLNIVKYLKNEVKSLPFRAADEGFYYLGKMLNDNYTSYNLHRVFDLIFFVDF